VLKFHVITLFPELIESYCSTSIIGRGVKGKKLSVCAYNPRDYCLDKYRKVDDTPYGGGAGMVLKPEPFFATFEAIERESNSPVLLMTPQGAPFQQNLAESLAKETDITIICGHYEGFDERIRTIATHEVCLGDFVLTGGELPALAVIDAVGRLVPGVLGKSTSLTHESFTESLLEGPQYTKPQMFRGMEVPEVLLSGNHQTISRWRRQQAIKRTFERRPELLENAELDDEDKRFLKSLKSAKPTDQT
jgi:tRNA (guanine37-N1)-methyltransferase